MVLPSATKPTRRAVITGASVVALSACTACLAACAPDAPATQTSIDPSQAPSSQAPSSAAPSSAPSSASSSTTADSSASGDAPSGPSVATADVPVGSGVIMEDADYVVTQPTKGEFKAFSKICTHAQNPVGQVDGDTIICDFHGSAFSITDGSVLNPPASTPLPSYPTTVSGDRVYVKV